MVAALKGDGRSLTVAALKEDGRSLMVAALKDDGRSSGVGGRAAPRAAAKCALGRGRVVLYSLLIPALMMLAAVPLTEHVKRYALVVVGFSAVIFFHEFGHFIVARLCSVKCEVFSIGIGPRMLGWRKGVGLTFGAEPARVGVAASAEPSTVAGLITEGDLPQTATDAHSHTSVVQTAGGKAAVEEEGRFGDCDYRISWLPLGGYVKMLGQDDMDPTKVSADRQAFNNRPIWQRMCIVSAGVTMNIIFAAVVFAVVFQIGVKFPPAIIGPVAYRSPAEEKGLKMGDKVTALDGKRTRGAFVEFSDLYLASALAEPGEEVKLTYRRGTLEDKEVAIVPQANGGPFQAIGVEPMPSLKIFGSDDSLEDMAKDKAEFKVLRAGDSIVKINDVAVREYPEFYRVLQLSRGQPVTLGMHNVDPKVADRTVTTTPVLIPRTSFVPAGAHYFLGLTPRPRIGEVQKKSAAEAAGIKEGDIVLRIGELSNPTLQELKSTVEKSAGQAIGIEVLRKGERMMLTATPADENHKGLLGVVLGYAFDTLGLANVEKGSPAAGAGVYGGETITAVNDKAVKTWQDLLGAMDDSGEKAATLTVVKPTGESVQATLAIAAEALSGPRAFAYHLGVNLENVEMVQKSTGVTDAALMGMDHTKKFVLQTYMTLRGLFNRSVSASNLHGIVGISKIGHDVQDKGMIYLFFILAMVSVNLAVANFLPLPIVDGGLFLLLILEKVRGKPLPLKVQSAIQVVGICLLAGLFLFVTYNDIWMYFPHK